MMTPLSLPAWSGSTTLPSHAGRAKGEIVVVVVDCGGGSVVTVVVTVVVVVVVWGGRGAVVVVSAAAVQPATTRPMNAKECHRRTLPRYPVVETTERGQIPGCAGVGGYGPDDPWWG